MQQASNKVRTDEILVKFFEETEGIDKDMKDLLNGKLSDIKMQYELKLSEQLNYQDSLLRLIAK